MFWNRQGTYPHPGNRIFSDHNVWVGIKKVFVIKVDVPEDAPPICDDAEFKGITEVPVDVHLLYGRVRGSMGGHGAVSGFVRGIRNAQSFRLFKGFQLPDNAVGIFRVIFHNPCLNAEGVKKQHGCFFFINLSAYWFGQVNHLVEHGF